MRLQALPFELLKVGHCTHPECVATRGGRWQSVMFPALCGLILHPTRGYILFDTGYSQHFMTATQPFPERLYRWTTPVNLPHEEQLLTQLAARGIRPADISHIVISHMHADHIAGLRDFPKARFIVSRAEYDQARRMSRLGGLLHAFLPPLLPDDMADRLDFVEDAPMRKLPPELSMFDSGFDLFNDGSILALPLPGHSRGQMGVVFKRADHRLVFMAADACWSRQALVENKLPTVFANRIFDHVGNYRRSFTLLREAAAHPEPALILPSHCEQSWKELSNDIK
ncbi:MBL fold metallo-hydrolase [Undibacterium sp. TS12]|uniref:MBL fold metallo-hydrolase n=1 Tax=Undibacterium sp. TS12 TaxID=2908202 RepID=UPI001F4CF044|nr:MBL fold metallo-hydrolase [Undibacterium sp. TS12]MCH8619716.1 MBL fold metallo-hydrolase [Undibacterium sp. TS12]